MTKPIKLIYWRDVPNLGDILSPYIVKELSKREIVYKNRWWGWKYYLKELWRISINRQWMDMRHLTHPFERVMLGVGSILKYANYNSVVWGAGFMNNHDTTKARNIIAVRGCLSASKVGEGGVKLRVTRPCSCPPFYLRHTRVKQTAKWDSYPTGRSSTTSHCKYSRKWTHQSSTVAV